MNKDEILRKLIESLEKLIKMMELDPKSRLIDVFRDNLDKAKSILSEQPVKKDDLVDLSHSITSIYQGGMGSFNDYAPGKYNPSTCRWTPIPGTEDFENVRSEVYNFALELRVIGRY